MGGDDGAFIDMKAPHGDDHDVRLRTYGDGQFAISGFGGSGTSAGTMANFHYTGAVELFYNNSKKLETTASGVSVTGTLAVTGDTSVDSTTQATSSTAAALTSAGGLGVAKKIIAGEDIECKTQVKINGSTSGALTIAAAAATTDFTLTLPAAVGSSGQVLRASDNAGTLEWYTISSTQIINGTSSIKIDVADDDIIHSVPTGKQHEFKVNSTEVLAVSGAGLNVTGTLTASGAVDFNGTGDIADTLTCSKASGTGLAVTANATVGGTLAVTGATTLTGALDANSTGDIADTLTCSKASGTGLAVTSNAVITGTCTATSFTSTSDARLKREISAYSGGLDAVLAIQPKSYKWDRDALLEAKHEGIYDEHTHVGVLAQDVEAAGLNEFVHDSEGVKSVDYSKLTAVLLGAVRELKSEVDHLRTLI
jgi:hypothetical protein